jgi:predicted glycoside hydrolase/deacetylase ChbG (UPF0249 family)
MLSLMKPMPMKHIVLCADDYGLNASVSQGIIDLLQRKRLSAVSCLTTSPLWPEEAPRLKPFREQVDLGLHFNLTEGKPLSLAYRERYGDQFLPLSRLIIQAFLRKWELSLIEAECQAQLDRFVAELGFLPDFIDGHQHIHQLPVIRDAVLRVYEKSLRSKKAYLRSVGNMVSSAGVWSKIKQTIIYLCGSAAFQSLLKKHAIPHNRTFAGIYSFPEAHQYPQLFPLFLKKSADQGLIMCHPGLNTSLDESDAIAQARFQEYSYLVGEQFEVDCQSLGAKVMKFPQAETVVKIP